MRIEKELLEKALDGMEFTCSDLEVARLKAKETGMLTIHEYAKFLHLAQSACELKQNIESALEDLK